MLGYLNNPVIITVFVIWGLCVLGKTLLWPYVNYYIILKDCSAREPLFLDVLRLGKGLPQLVVAGSVGTYHAVQELRYQLQRFVHTLLYQREQRDYQHFPLGEREKAVPETELTVEHAAQLDVEQQHFQKRRTEQ